MLFLDKVKDLWEPARGFLILMRYEVFDEEQMDQLFEIFRGVIDNTYDELKKRKIQKAMELMDQIAEKEKRSEEINLEAHLDQILSEV